MTFLVKPIKPGKMDLRQLEVALHDVLHGEGRIHVQEFDKTVKTWRHKVGFGYDVGVSGNDASVLSGPVSGAVENWTRLDEGTRPHPIVARRAPLLRFRRGYTAKTRPWWLGSQRGGSHGDWVSKKSVMHPGTQAREWTKTLASKRKRPFARNVNAALKRGAARLYRR